MRFVAFAPPSYNNKKKTISCKKCTPSQTTHLTCMICSKTQTLDKFAKVQSVILKKIDKGIDFFICSLNVEMQKKLDA
jgi:hypothetical protein